MALVDTKAKRVLAAMLVGICLSLLIFPFVNHDPGAMPRLGDLPGFYGLGRIVLQGEGQRLYDFNLQREVQNTFWPNLVGDLFPTMYPPVVAAVMAPLSALPPTLLHILLASLSLVTLCYLVRWQAQDFPVERLSLILFSVPTFITIVAPQTTIFSLLCIVACRHFLCKSRPFAAGLCAGLLLYKPQIGLPFALITSAGSGPLFLYGLILAAAAEYVVGAIAFGGEWLIPWTIQIIDFSKLRLSLDQFQFTAITGGVAPLLLTGEFARRAQLVIAGALLVTFCAFSWRRREQPTPRDNLIALFLVSSPVFLPQTNFYDLAIALFTLLISAPLASKRFLNEMIVAVLLVNLCIAIRSPQLSLVPIAALIVASSYLRRGVASHLSTTTPGKLS